MLNPFERKRIKPIKGQEGPILDVAKARAMAAEEDTARQTYAIDAYKNYLASPSSDAPGAERFEEFKAWGVTPEYLEAVAENKAERVGAKYDAELAAPGMSDLALRVKHALNDLYTRFALPGLEPTQGLPPHDEAVSQSAKWGVAFDRASAASNELARRDAEKLKNTMQENGWTFPDEESA
ncbi:MAG TPA: hypothetical protein VFY28_02295 [Candidatus Paceibacterota bacterium]|nr:hypothetical protein [Candidatus Paceibacterota bacterium]